ncbi:MAG TPA: hypothetical protein VE988_20145, partial [Gemmataceae bacterium]|nr:hypothetical protein [Gemmataceae bacterium]
FVLFGVPFVLSGTFKRSLAELPFQRESTSLGDAITEVWAGWWVWWIVYYLFIVGGGAFLIWMRRDVTVVYNVDPRTLDSVLAKVAQRLGMEMDRQGNRLYLAGNQHHDADAPADGITALPITLHRPPPAISAATIDLDPFPLLSNVSLHWRNTAPDARIDLERELRAGLSEVVTADNQTGSWLFSISALLFIVILLLTAAFIGIVMVNVSRR